MSQLRLSVTPNLPPMLDDRSEGLEETSPLRPRRQASSGSVPHRSESRPASPGSAAVVQRLAFLRLVFERGLALLEPARDERAALGYVFPTVEAVLRLAPGAGRDFLEDLANRGYLRREVFGFVLLCPRCEERTSEHVYLPAGERAPCRACAHAFGFEEGRLVRIHRYEPTLFARRTIDGDDAHERRAESTRTPGRRTHRRGRRFTRFHRR